MSQGVQSRGSSEIFRKTAGQLRIVDGIPGDETEILNGVLVVGFAVSNHSSQGHFTACACGGGDGNHKRQLSVNF